MQNKPSNNDDNEQRDKSSQNITNALKEYYDFYNKWGDFALKYNKSLFEAASEAFRVFLDEGEKLNDLKKIQNKTRTVFDSKLQQRLCEDEISSSLASLVNSWLDIIKLSGYDKYHSSYTDFLLAWDKFFDPFRNYIKWLQSSDE